MQLALSFHITIRSSKSTTELLKQSGTLLELKLAAHHTPLEPYLPHP
jgi:hypothetical protein